MATKIKSKRTKPHHILPDAVKENIDTVSDQYWRRRLESACARALSFGAPQFRTVKQILVQGLDQQPDLVEIAELEAPYLGAGRFSRNTSDLLH